MHYNFVPESVACSLVCVDVLPTLSESVLSNNLDYRRCMGLPEAHFFSLLYLKESIVGSDSIDLFAKRDPYVRVYNLVQIDVDRLPQICIFVFVVTL